MKQVSSIQSVVCEKPDQSHHGNFFASHVFLLDLAFAFEQLVPSELAEALSSSDEDVVRGGLLQN
mgnify:FL=1